jgi:uncharacterized protein (TIGR00730 family)
VAERVLEIMLHISKSDADASDWQLIEGTLADMASAFSVFNPHRQIRKLAIFGSARTHRQDSAYGLAMEVASLAVGCGFEVMTGAGGGVMEGANLGAGEDRSFGLDVQLPFEHFTNPFINSSERLLSFRYFHTRKLFFLRETDALVVLPGGFGTLDELFEVLTLIQTAKNPPVPVILLAAPEDDYWQRWQNYINTALLERGLISPQDNCLYGSADSAQEALRQIRRFYRVFNSSRHEANKLQLRLNCNLPAQEIVILNQTFSHLLLDGMICFKPLANGDNSTGGYLEFCFDQRQVGGLYALIYYLNSLDLAPCAPLEHPEQRLNLSQ